MVFDPFGGSGSTLIACETTGRQARLIEIDPKYVDVIVKRWQDYTSQKAVLEADLRCFEQIATERLTKLTTRGPVSSGNVSLDRQ